MRFSKGVGFASRLFSSARILSTLSSLSLDTCTCIVSHVCISGSTVPQSDLSAQNFLAGRAHQDTISALVLSQACEQQHLNLIYLPLSQSHKAENNTQLADLLSLQGAIQAMTWGLALQLEDPQNAPHVCSHGDDDPCCHVTLPFSVFFQNNYA